MNSRYSIWRSAALACLCAVSAIIVLPKLACAGSLDISSPLLVDLREVMPLLENSSGKAEDDAGFHTALGGIYINIGTLDPKRASGPEYDPPEFSLAEKHLRKAMGQAPQMALPQYYMGLLETNRQDNDKALSYLKKALALDPMDVRIHQQIHTIYFAQGKYATATLFLEDSVKTLPREANLYHRLAVTYMALENIHKARQNINKSLSIEYDPESQNLLAATYMKAGNYVKAIQEFRNVLERSPGNINAMLGNARAYALNGEINEAALWVGEVLSIDRENEEALLLLKKIQEARRNTQ